jgi:hypothetical protein
MLIETQASATMPMAVITTGASITAINTTSVTAIVTVVVTKIDRVERVCDGGTQQLAATTATAVVHRVIQRVVVLVLLDGKVTVVLIVGGGGSAAQGTVGNYVGNPAEGTVILCCWGRGRSQGTHIHRRFDAVITHSAMRMLVSITIVAVANIIDADVVVVIIIGTLSVETGIVPLVICFELLVVFFACRTNIYILVLGAVYLGALDMHGIARLLIL